MRILPLSAALLAAFTAGCEADPPARAPATAVKADTDTGEITRDAAVDMARHDAAARFGDLGGVSFVDAQMLGRFWVVELHSRSGQGVRYAISRNDGAIKQRTMVR